MSTKINTLELYVNGKEVYPNLNTATPLEKTIGYTPKCFTDSTTLAQRIKEHPTNIMNRNLRSELDPAVQGYDYWYNLDNTLIFWPILTSAQLSNISEPYDIGGPDCVSYPNTIDLSQGIIDLYNPLVPRVWPSTGVGYEWHYNWHTLSSGKDYVLGHYGHTLGLNFNKCDTLQFSGTMNTFVNAFDSTKDYAPPYYRWMFQGCDQLTTIVGLNLTGFDMTHTNAYQNPTDNLDKLLGLERYFMNCESLTTFTNVTWPQQFTGPCYGYMFYNCRSLPDNQFPTMAFTLAGNIDDGQGGTVPLGTNCEYIFYGCKNLTSQHIPTSSLQYVSNLRSAYEYSGVQSIELPANMNTNTNLSLMIEGCSELTQLIIRTEGLIEYKDIWYPDEIEPNNEGGWSGYNRLFISGNVDLLNENLAIYVPDSELQDWIDVHANTGESDIDQRISDMFHGLSELSE